MHALFTRAPSSPTKAQISSPISPPIHRSGFQGPSADELRRLREQAKAEAQRGRSHAKVDPASHKRSVSAGTALVAARLGALEAKDDEGPKIKASRMRPSGRRPPGSQQPQKREPQGALDDWQLVNGEEKEKEKENRRPRPKSAFILSSVPFSSSHSNETDGDNMAPLPICAHHATHGHASVDAPGSGKSDKTTTTSSRPTHQRAQSSGYARSTGTGANGAREEEKRRDEVRDVNERFEDLMNEMQVPPALRVKLSTLKRPVKEAMLRGAMNNRAPNAASFFHPSTKGINADPNNKASPRKRRSIPGPLLRKSKSSGHIVLNGLNPEEYGDEGDSDEDTEQDEAKLRAFLAGQGVGVGARDSGLDYGQAGTDEKNTKSTTDQELPPPPNRASLFGEPEGSRRRPIGSGPGSRSTSVQSTTAVVNDGPLPPTPASPDPRGMSTASLLSNTTFGPAAGEDALQAALQAAAHCHHQKHEEKQQGKRRPRSASVGRGLLLPLNGRESRATSGDGTGSGAGGKLLLGGIGGSGMKKEEQNPAFFALFLKTGKSVQMDLGPVKKLRVLLRNESVGWLDDFVRFGGYAGLLDRLNEILGVEWREEQHDDKLLHELLRCFVALPTTETGLAALRSSSPAPFKPLMDLLMGEKKPGDLATRKLITDLLATIFDLYPDSSSLPSSDSAPSLSAHRNAASFVRSLLLNPPDPTLESAHDFITSAHIPRPFKHYLLEVAGVCRDYFWVFCHRDNRFWRWEDMSEEEREEVVGPKVPGGMTGGVEFEAMGYLTSNFRLMNMLGRALAYRDKLAGRRAEPGSEAYEYYKELMASGMERIILTLRKSSQTYYMPLHLELAQFIHLAREAAYALPLIVTDWLASPRRDANRLRKDRGMLPPISLGGALSLSPPAAPAAAAGSGSGPGLSTGDEAQEREGQRRTHRAPPAQSPTRPQCKASQTDAAAQQPEPRPINKRWSSVLPMDGSKSVQPFSSHQQTQSPSLSENEQHQNHSRGGPLLPIKTAIPPAAASSGPRAPPSQPGSAPASRPAFFPWGAATEQTTPPSTATVAEFHSSAAAYFSRPGNGSGPAPCVSSASAHTTNGGRCSNSNSDSDPSTSHADVQASVGADLRPPPPNAYAEGPGWKDSVVGTAVKRWEARAQQQADSGRLGLPPSKLANDPRRRSASGGQK